MGRRPLVFFSLLLLPLQPLSPSVFHLLAPLITKEKFWINMYLHLISALNVWVGRAKYATTCTIATQFPGHG